MSEHVRLYSISCNITTERYGEICKLSKSPFFVNNNQLKFFGGRVVLKQGNSAISIKTLNLLFKKIVRKSLWIAC